MALWDANYCNHSVIGLPQSNLSHQILQCVYLYVPVCMGRSKANAGQYLDNAWEGGSFLIHTLIFRIVQKKLAIIYTYTVKLVTFTCGMEVCILTIIDSTIIFNVADIIT